MTYYEALKSPKWQKKRLEIMERDNFKCRKCGDKDTTLNVHHLEYGKGKKPWDYDNFKLITLCQDCHQHIEKFKRQSSWDSQLTFIKGGIDSHKYLDILQLLSLISGNVSETFEQKTELNEDEKQLIDNLKGKFDRIILDLKDFEEFTL